MAILTGMMGQYVAVAVLAFCRIRAGRNGATLAIMVNAAALALLSATRVFDIFDRWQLGGIAIVLALFAVFGTNFYLIFALRLEAGRPIKRQTATMEKLHRRIK